METLIVKVPQVPCPKDASGLCWTTAPGSANGYCTKPVGHKERDATDLHTWERKERQ